ncbi:hypothetical protein ACIP1X_27910, partial [Pseudomonas sp. NPDC088885]|uniref:hypothetical protein n=1 Tax=Pseudomonas sp. NPDC088885 TaxID=3364457 RepID=UPI0037FCFE2E
PISTIPPNQGGARHFAGELYALQGIMTGDGKLTTSHAVTECRTCTVESLTGRALQGFWRNMEKFLIGDVNRPQCVVNGGSKPRPQALVGRLYDFRIQSVHMRQIVISVGLWFF